MANLLQEITAKAVQLPRPQWLALAGFLLELEDADEPDLEASWDQEIRSRIEAYDAGLMESEDYTHLQSKMKSRFAP